MFRPPGVKVAPPSPWRWGGKSREAPGGRVGEGPKPFHQSLRLIRVGGDEARMSGPRNTGENSRRRRGSGTDRSLSDLRTPRRPAPRTANAAHRTGASPFGAHASAPGRRIRRRVCGRAQRAAVAEWPVPPQRRWRAPRAGCCSPRRERPMHLRPLALHPTRDATRARAADRRRRTTRPATATAIPRTARTRFGAVPHRAGVAS